MVAADGAVIRSITKFKDNEDKIMVLDQNKLLAAVGPNGDRVEFTEYIQRNIALYNLRNSVPLSTHAAASFTR